MPAALPEGVSMIAQILGKLTTGDVPLESMGGPLQIAQVATQSAEAGLAAFVGSMYMVSVNLALVNLLPIPILDGFGILTALWEAIRRRPVPMRAREVATYFGLAVLGFTPTQISGFTPTVPSKKRAELSALRS